jgi:O-antigen ligase
VVLITVLGFLNAFWAVDPLLALYRYFVFLVFIVAIFNLKYLFPKLRFYLLLIFLASLFIQALIGIGQFSTQTSFPSTLLGMSQHEAAYAGTAVVETDTGRWLRAYGPQDHPNIFGGLMVLAALICLYLFLKNEKKSIHLLSLIFYPIFLWAAFASFSRAALLALVLALLFILLENWRSIKKLLTFLLLTVIIAGIFVRQYQPLILIRARGESRLEQVSNIERQNYNQAAWQLWRKHPYFGVGLSNSTLLLAEEDKVNLSILPAWQYQPAHNYWLLVLSEGGILFLIPILFAWSYFYKKSRQEKIIGLFVALFVLSLFDHWLFSLPLSSALPWLFLALI